MKRETQEKWKRACLMVACNYNEPVDGRCDSCVIRRPDFDRLDEFIWRHMDMASLALDGCDIRELP